MRSATDHILAQIERWRTSADKLLIVAGRLKNEVARDELLDMAEAYNRLADRMEDLVVEHLAKRLKASGATSYH